MMSFGRSASALAIPMRCRWPPLNSCGNRPRYCPRRPTTSSSSLTIFSRSCADPTPWTSSPSPTISPTDMRGFSDPYGSWKMICTSRRISCSSLFFARKMLRPSSQASPEVGGIRRRMVRATVDLPDPDSPISPRVSPCLISKLTPSTALTLATVVCKRPPLIGKYLTRSCTLSSAPFFSVTRRPSCCRIIRTASRPPGAPRQRPSRVGYRGHSGVP